MKRRPLITLLLCISCIVSGVILYFSPKFKVIDMDSMNNLDSLITQHFYDEPLIGSEFRKFNIKVDSTFSRTVYRVNVPGGFSKTMFHFKLHQTLQKYGFKSPARVIFPERDMNIYIQDDNVIRSTIRLITVNPKPSIDIENG